MRDGRSQRISIDPFVTVSPFARVVAADDPHGLELRDTIRSPPIVLNRTRQHKDSERRNVAPSRNGDPAVSRTTYVSWLPGPMWAIPLEHEWAAGRPVPLRPSSPFSFVPFHHEQAVRDGEVQHGVLLDIARLQTGCGYRHRGVQPVLLGLRCDEGLRTRAWLDRRGVAS